MITARLRRRLENSRRWYGLFYANSVFAQGLGLALVAVSCTHLKSALAVSWLVSACTLCLTPVARLEMMTKRSKMAQSLVYLLLSGVILQFAAWPLRKNGILITELGAYLPLAGVNTLTLTLCFAEQHERRPRYHSGRAWVWSLGFTTAACLIGAVRELLAFGTLWGRALPLSTPSLPVAALPFGGVLATGLLCAAIRGFGRWRRRMLITLGDSAKRPLPQEGTR